MSAQCDKCIVNLPWKIDLKYGLISTQWSTTPFSFPAYVVQFKTVVQELLGRGIGSTEEPVPLFNLCGKCWATQAMVWLPERGAATYKDCAAKAADTGVYFQNERPDYEEGGKPDLDKIRSTCIHESMHYMSHEHAGLQAYENGKKVHWDECVTDFLARKVYFATGKGPYKTAYGVMSEFIERGLAQLFADKLATGTHPKIVPVFKLKSLQSELGTTAPFSEAFVITNLKDGKLDPTYRDKFELAIAKWFATWYLVGENTLANNRTLSQFLNSELGKTFAGKLNDADLKYGVATTHGSK